MDDLYIFSLFSLFLLNPKLVFFLLSCFGWQFFLFRALFSLLQLALVSFRSFLASGSFFLSFEDHQFGVFIRTKIKTTGALCALFLSLFSRITPIYAQKVEQ